MPADAKRHVAALETGRDRDAMGRQRHRFETLAHFSWRNELLDGLTNFLGAGAVCFREVLRSLARPEPGQEVILGDRAVNGQPFALGNAPDPWKIDIGGKVAGAGLGERINLL